MCPPMNGTAEKQNASKTSSPKLTTRARAVNVRPPQQCFPQVYAKYTFARNAALKYTFAYTSRNNCVLRGSDAPELWYTLRRLQTQQGNTKMNCIKKTALAFAVMAGLTTVAAERVDFSHRPLAAGRAPQLESSAADCESWCWS